MFENEDVINPEDVRIYEYGLEIPKINVKRFL